MSQNFSRNAIFREAFIREFLETHLNSTVAIGTGEIIDCQSKPNEKRNQFDIVIYKRNYPRLDFGGGVNGFLVESVIATIEVKSTLDKSGVEQAVHAACAAKQLRKNEVKSFSAGYIPPSVMSLVVAYDGPARMETVYTWVKETYKAEGIVEPDMPTGDRAITYRQPCTRWYIRPRQRLPHCDIILNYFKNVIELFQAPKKKKPAQ